jgi:hypothetical protein
MKKSITFEIKALGFSPLTRSIWWCRAGDLIHAVVLGKDRYGELSVSPVVWHSSLLGDAEKFQPSSLQSPIAGSVSPSGISSSWTWPASEIDAKFICDVLVKFFEGFADSSDIRRVLDGAFVSPFYEERLANGKQRPDVDSMVSSRAKYAVEGGALSPKLAYGLASSFFEKLVAPLGFVVIGGEDIVAVRKRGKLHDCIRILPDLFCSFATITCFPWTTDIWRVDKRWKGTYYPMIPFDLCQNGRPVLAQTAQLEKVDRSMLRELIVERLSEISHISDNGKFAESLGSQWNGVARSLRLIR